MRSYKWAMEAVLAHAEVKVLVYAGVLDLRYNYLALDAWTRSMDWAGAAALRAAPLAQWTPHGSGGDNDNGTGGGNRSWGEVRRARQLSVLRVSNAGHETCRDRPQACPAFFSDFVLQMSAASAVPIKTDDDGCNGALPPPECVYAPHDWDAAHTIRSTSASSPRMCCAHCVSQAFSSWQRSILTEIYLCHACSHHVLEDGNGPGRRR
eukprot:COSAG01_NODE_160_length_23692_cov_9.703599_10_plen_208_part_00